jgi:hypothetical protein
VKRLATSFLGAVVIAGLGVVAALASPPNITGTWQVQQTGLNGNSTATITLQQSGNGVVGTNAANGNGFTGAFVNDTQINGKWHGPGGAGWLTVYVSPNGHSLNGEWGYNGRKPNGSFVGNKVLPPSPITAAGTWKVAGAGGPTGFVGNMRCTQSGPSVVCHAGPILIQGKFRTTNKVRASWTGPSNSGWFSFWFNNDNNSFNGIWGYGSDMSKETGRVIGQRAL